MALRRFEYGKGEVDPPAQFTDYQLNLQQINIQMSPSESQSLVSPYECICMSLSCTFSFVSTLAQPPGILLQRGERDTGLGRTV